MTARFFLFFSSSLRKFCQEKARRNFPRAPHAAFIDLLERAGGVLLPKKLKLLKMFMMMTLKID